jgi:hypothetical protein
VKDKKTLSELHAHVCSESGEAPLMCDANESNTWETGVCNAWDALRDAYHLGCLEERNAVLKYEEQHGAQLDREELIGAVAEGAHR